MNDVDQRAEKDKALAMGEPKQESDFSLNFHQSKSGLWFVTSEERPSIFMANLNLDAIIDDLPNVLRLRMKRAAEIARTGASP